MAAPEKKYLALPTVLPTQPNTVQLKLGTHEEAIEIAIRRAIGEKIQMQVFEAIEYVEPDIVPEVVTAVVKEIP